MRFLIAKKSAINRKNRDLETPKRNSPDKSGQPGGMRGATGEGTMGRGQRSLHEFCMQCEAEFCRMLTCIRHALPWLEARGGGFNSFSPKILADQEALDEAVLVAFGWLPWPPDFLPAAGKMDPSIFQLLEEKRVKNGFAF